MKIINSNLTFNFLTFLKARKLATTLFFSMFILSCQKDTTLDTLPVGKSISSEQKEIIEYLQLNGFVLSNIDGIVAGIKERQKITNIEDAKKLVSFINQFKDYKAASSLSQTIRNGRLLFPNCEDQGTYFIGRAINGFASGVDIRFERDFEGNLSNITSNSSGLMVAWSWSQRGVSTFNNDRFCIDATMIYGVEIEGIILGYSANVALNVHLQGCNAIVSSWFGHC